MLLQSGLVPRAHTDKRPAAIKSQRRTWPSTCAAASASQNITPPPVGGTRKNYPDRRPPAKPLVQSINCEIVSRLLIRRCFEEQLAGSPDVLTAAQIARLTGYSAKTVSRWCSAGRLKSILRQPKYMVPKVWLLDFLASDDYNNICRKSGRHYAMIREISK